MTALDVRLLGGIAVEADGEDVVALGGRRPKAVLALLALRAGTTVHEDTLLAEVWADRPPPSARNSLQSYISRLRTALPDGGRHLVRRGPGYLLAVNRCDIDVHRFDDAVDAGGAALEAGRPVEARAAFARAFSEWRGEPLFELVDEPFARAASARLTERCVEAIERDAAAGLTLGAHRALVPRLNEAVATYPLHEELWRLLMLALYRSGRQVEALRRYEEVRHLLDEQIGVEPGPALRAAHLAILRQEVDLRVPVAV